MRPKRFSTLSRRALGVSAALSLASALAACGATDDGTQTITGQVSVARFGAPVLGARAVAGASIVATSKVSDAGGFRLRIPRGADYRLEVVTAAGARPLLGHDLTALRFDVCAAVQPYDIGTVFRGDDPGRVFDKCAPRADGTCAPGGTGDPTCDDDHPCPPCEGTDCAPGDGSGSGSGGDPGCDGANCPPDKCDGANCPPPPPPCDGANCPPPPPPCDGTDCPSPPGDPSCGADKPCPQPGDGCDDDHREFCDPGCAVATPAGTDSCWPSPNDPSCAPGSCDPSRTAVPQKMLPNFGCDVVR
jgi:hypothetical protein